MRSAPRGVLVVALVTVLLGLSGSPATAHGDGPGHDDGSLTLAPGTHRPYPIEVHWHRVVGTVRAADPADARAEVLVLDEAAYGAFQAGEPYEATIRAGPSASIRLNALIRCCDDAAWTPYRIVVRNVGDQAATFDVQLQTVHDDAGVALTAAESGGIPVFTTLIFVGAAAVLGRRVWPRIRSAPPARSDGSTRLRAGDPALGAGLAGAAVLTLLAGSTLAGFLAFGGSPIEAAVAGLALLPFPTNELIGRGAALLGLALVGTLYTMHAWTRALQARRGDASGRLLAGGALAATAMVGVLVLGVATYGTEALVGGVVMTVPLALVVAAGLDGVRRAPSGTP